MDLLAVLRDSQESSPTPEFKSINSLALSFLHNPNLTSIHDYWKNHSFDYIWTFVGKVISLLFNMLSRFVIGNRDFIWRGGPPKSLQMVTAAMKLKDACSLEEKL